ncbi:MAG: hypothetical protein R3E09_06785 [Novosphingobium sp.]
MQWIAFTIAAGAAPPIYGYLFDIYGNYSMPLYISAGILFGAPFLLLGLGPYPDLSSAREVDEEVLNPS